MQAEQVRKDRERIQELESQLASSAANLQVSMLLQNTYLVSLVEQSRARIYCLLAEIAALCTRRGRQRRAFHPV